MVDMAGCSYTFCNFKTHRPNAITTSVYIVTKMCGKLLDLHHWQRARVVLEECLGGEPVVRLKK